MPSLKSKILLVNPPGEFKTPVLPLGLASIAAYLKDKDKNIEIAVIDAWAEDLGFEELKNRVSQTRADIIGIYMISPLYDKGKKTIEVCRKTLPNSLIIAGGPHPSALPQETLKDIPQLDICAIGEGEVTMYELVRAVEKKSLLSEIDGIAFRKDNEIIITKPRALIKKLDDLPFPARELFPLEKYKIHPPYGRKNPSFTILNSRGCPFQCAYCSKGVYQDAYRARSPEKVCDEIEGLIKKYGAKEIQFYDDDFTLDMRRAEKICDEILRRGIKIYWSCITRVDLVNENLLKKMKKAGCWLIAYGVESGNQKILDAINKGFTVKQIISAFEATKRIGLTTVCYFMIGLPGDTKETIRDTLDLVKKIRPDFISCSILIAYPGSRLFKLIQQGKYQGKLRILTKRENLAGSYFGKGNYTVFEDNLTFEELRRIAQKTNREFYLRPGYIFQTLKNIRSFSNLRHYLRGGLEMVKSLIG